jgi:hypothetical protein
MAAEQAASSRTASVASSHTTEQIISVVTVEAADRPSAVTVALAVVSEALTVSMQWHFPEHFGASAALTMQCKYSEIVWSSGASVQVST